MRLIPRSLQGRFFAGVIVIMLCMGCFFSFMTFLHMKELLYSEAVAKANMMVAHTEAIQRYVRTVLRPSVSSIIPHEDMIIEAMSSSFITRNILSLLEFEDKNFQYRRVAVNARNPDYEITPEESVFLEQLRNDPGLQRINKTVKIDSKAMLVMARPVRFSEDCLWCHGQPKDAPRTILERYGETKGFFRKPDEVAGLDMIAVPLESEKGFIIQSVLSFAFWFAMGMLVLIVILQSFFQRLVVKNLRKVSAILQRGVPSEERLAPAVTQAGVDDIGIMLHNIRTMASRLFAAKKQLSLYAKGLEIMVQDRTADLEQVANNRRADVELLVKLLSDLNVQQDKKRLLSSAVKLVAGHFKADRAVYLCGLSGESSLFIPDLTNEAEQQFKLSILGKVKDHLANERSSFSPDEWYIPVQTSGETRGIMALFWENKHDNKTEQNIPGEEDMARSQGGAERQMSVTVAQESPISEGQKALALAFGRQLGIALDNFDAIDVLLRQNVLLDSLVEGIDDPLLLLAKDASLILANTSAVTLSNRLFVEAWKAKSTTAAEQMGLCSKEAMNGLIASTGILDNKAEVFEKPTSCEVTVKNGDSYAVTTRPLFTPEGDASRVIIHMRDTTEEKRFIAHMHQSEKMAAVGQLASGLAHEINNPLGVIRCYAELLEGSTDNDQSKKDIAVILRHIDKAQAVLRELLDFARPKENQIALTDSKSIIASVAELFKPQCKAAGVELVIEAVEEKLEVFVDRAKLEQVLVNLVLNALDSVKAHTASQQGRICVAAWRNSGSICLCVADNGPGIEPSRQAKVFDPFYTTKSQSSNTGLGLTLAFSMVQKMGGSLDLLAKSVLPSDTPESFTAPSMTGAIFMITLPAPDEALL